ncbi:MAG: beta-propeller fold lactonase family protein [Enterobacteriaceae bacterium]
MRNKSILYVSSLKSKKIFVWKLNTNGKLNLLQILNIRYNIYDITINNKNNFLYVTTRPEPKLVILKIKNNFCLSFVKIFNLKDISTYIKYYNNKIYSVSYRFNSLSVYNIYDNKIEMSEYLNNLPGCHSIKILKNSLIIPCLKSDNIFFFKINKKNKLDTKKLNFVSLPKKSGPRNIAIHPNKSYIYSINELKGTVTLIKMDKKKIKILDNYNIYFKKKLKDCWSSDIKISKDGKNLYCSDRLSSTIHIFNILKKGKLKLIKIFKTEKTPKNFVIDKTNKFIIVIGQKSNFISVYKKRNNNIFLKSRNFTGIEPVWIKIINKKF